MIRRTIALYWLLIVAASAMGQVHPTPTIVEGYSFITGVDVTKWYPLVGYYNTGHNISGYVFPATLWNRQMTFYEAQANGNLCMKASSFDSCNIIAGWPNYNENITFAYTLDRHNPVMTFKDYAYVNSTTPTRNWQVVFSQTGKVFDIVYGPNEDDQETQASIVITPANSSTSIIVDQTNHTASTGNPEDFTGGGWPGLYRYYEFMPECHLPDLITIDSIEEDSVKIKWNTTPGHWFGMYADAHGTGIDTNNIIWTNNNFCWVPLTEFDTNTKLYVVSPCYLRDPSPTNTKMVEMFCSGFANLVDYSIYSHSAFCTIFEGYGQDELNWRVNFGPNSIESRHTIHCDTTETDVRTQGRLRTVPPGYQSSIRLGNWMTGAEGESVVYTLRVDTSEYDLLMLRYALVEQNPNHPSGNPTFTYSINDSTGHLISECYFGNFVSNDNSGWNTALNDVVWKDWTWVAVDLDPLHGQTIQVKVRNSDCLAGGHYGYGYYILDGATKRLYEKTCGASEQYLFRAPQGFTYRWYADEAPETTLSTADTLLAAVHGPYSCRIGFLTGDSSCGYTMHVFAGSRFPKAAFEWHPNSNCPTQISFTNTSHITYNEDGTDATSYPCDSYLWDFGDGSTTTEASPTHYFEPGNYTVKLYAMLEGGCIDSTTFNINSMPLEVNLIDSVCGDSYRFGDTLLTESGQYEYLGIDPEGCDTLVRLNLCLRPLPNVQYELWQNCNENSDSSYYINLNTLPENLLYEWECTTPGGVQPRLDGDSILRFSPTEWTRYLFSYRYSDAPECRITDTFDLQPSTPIRALMDVSPKRLGPNDLDITVKDHSINATGRWWFVDSVELDYQGPILSYSAASKRDSMLITLVAYNRSCRDTANTIVPIDRENIYFPNVFTPNGLVNRVFQPIGIDIHDYELWIYDRRGVLMYHTTEYDQPWDGTSHGIPCKQEAYAYVCRYRNSSGFQTHAGTVVLLR
ncbi:MAG: gliding motility-associated C-terminal domain-containing protein [Bacteroidales bacterium]|nr:gliding motility-associated C-terminal domain-containing protein [Bacteroidales bacterium]